MFLKINERGHGYRLATPQGSVVDLGTEFGVAIHPVTRAVETHVIQGEVEVRPGDVGEPVPLKKNEALHFTTTHNEKIAANAGAFYRSLPPPRSTDMTMVHWSMEPDENSTVLARTHRIDQESTQLQLENYPEPVDEPKKTQRPRSPSTGTALPGIPQHPPSSRAARAAPPIGKTFQPSGPHSPTPTGSKSPA